MTEMRESATSYEPVEGDSILVSSQDAELVTSTLKDELGILVGRSEPDSRLGLTLLEFVPPAQLDDRDLGRASEKAPEVFVLGGPGELVLDAVLGRLREIFRARNAAWIPTMGKNRTLTQSIEGGVIIREDEYPPGLAGEPTTTLAAFAPGDHPVRVGLLDTPFVTHPWLSDRTRVIGANRLDPGTPNWRTGHSTFLAGLIAHQAPNAEIVVFPALNPLGRGSAWDVARRIADIAERNAKAAPNERIDVLNISSGTFTYDGQAPLALAAAVALLGPEVVVVAAAGNHGRDPRRLRAGAKYQWGRRPIFPAASAPVVAVGSADERGDRSTFSPEAPWVDVTTQGEELISTYLPSKVAGFEKASAGRDARYLGDPPTGTVREFDGFAQWSGTSFATARVSGAIAAAVDRDTGVSARQAWSAIRAGLGSDRYLPLPLLS